MWKANPVLDRNLPYGCHYEDVAASMLLLRRLGLDCLRLDQRLLAMT